MPIIDKWRRLLRRFLQEPDPERVQRDALREAAQRKPAREHDTGAEVDALIAAQDNTRRVRPPPVPQRAKAEWESKPTTPDNVRAKRGALQWTPKVNDKPRGKP